MLLRLCNKASDLDVFGKWIVTILFSSVHNQMAILPRNPVVFETEKLRMSKSEVQPW
jgi:hypothetical protein